MTEMAFGVRVGLRFLTAAEIHLSLRSDLSVNSNENWDINAKDREFILSLMAGELNSSLAPKTRAGSPVLSQSEIKALVSLCERACAFWMVRGWAKEYGEG